MHQRPGSKPKFDVRLLSENCTIFHEPKTWLHARVLMSVYSQTVVQFSMHQRPGFTSGFDVRHLSDSRILIFHAPKTWLHIRFLCQTPVRQLYNLHAPKTWLKASVLMSGYYGHLNSLPCSQSI